MGWGWGGVSLPPFPLMGGPTVSHPEGRSRKIILVERGSDFQVGPVTVL